MVDFNRSVVEKNNDNSVNKEDTTGLMENFDSKEDDDLNHGTRQSRIDGQL